LSTVEIGEDRSAESGKELPASTTRRGGARRRRITQGEEREIVRLYADNSTSTAEIRLRFGIGDSSLYRVVQRHGVALRGHYWSLDSVKTQPSEARGRDGVASFCGSNNAPDERPRSQEIHPQRRPAHDRHTSGGIAAWSSLVSDWWRRPAALSGSIPGRKRLRGHRRSRRAASSGVARSHGDYGNRSGQLAGRPGASAPAPAVGTCASDLPARARMRRGRRRAYPARPPSFHVWEVLFPRRGDGWCMRMCRFARRALRTSLSHNARSNHSGSK